jgi:hypothetical protein
MTETALPFDSSAAKGCCLPWTANGEWRLPKHSDFEEILVTKECIAVAGVMGSVSEGVNVLVQTLSADQAKMACDCR